MVLPKNMILSDIPTDTFNQILKDLRSDGWGIVSEYDGMDAWIDYGNIVLGKDAMRLIFEWDNWYEGVIWSAGGADDSDDLLRELQFKYNLSPSEP